MCASVNPLRIASGAHDVKHPPSDLRLAGCGPAGWGDRGALLWPSTKPALSIQSIIASIMAALPKGPPPLKMLKKRIHTRVADPTPSNAGDRLTHCIP